MDSENPGQRKIVEFPQSEDERARRLLDLVQRRASQPRTEWLFYFEDDAKRYGIEATKLKELIEAEIGEREKKVREEKEADRAREQRQQQQRREQERQQDRTERKERQDERDEEQKLQKRIREFEKIKKLPRSSHEQSLMELAAQLGEDLELLRDEFEVFIGDSGKDDSTSWPEPVDGAELLKDVTKQLTRHVVFQEDDQLVVSLWTMFAWCHDHATHSPILQLSGPEPDSGKTTLCGVLLYLTPRAYAGAEITGPGLYRLVDFLHPTLIVDDADRLVERKLDLMHILNASWTRGTKIPRNGVWYDPFCPKVLAGVDIRLPKTTASRAINIVMWPKLPSEEVEDFGYTDNPDFITLRRRLSRWSADNAPTLAAAKPDMPPGFINRIGANWRLLIAIADATGVGKQARAAATKFLARRRSPSEGIRLLAALQEIWLTRDMLSSQGICDLLAADKDGEWANFHGKGRPITPNQLRELLRPYGIGPGVIHPSKRSTDSQRGYKAVWFKKAFERFEQYFPNKRTSVHGKGKK
jgi:Protein of unknown function (DUF3631)